MKNHPKTFAITFGILAMAFCIAQVGVADELKTLNERIAASPQDARLLAARARLHSTASRHTEAVADLDRAIQLQPDRMELIDFRGSEHLLAGQTKEALADFDRFLKKHPDQAPYHWKRGIALYYAGEYGKGVEQFDIHQTVNPADVENAVWRAICMARKDGWKVASEDLLHVGPDSRVPMSEVYELFAGKATVENVLTAAKAGKPSPEELRTRLFYAELYIGLYYDAKGDAAKAAEHLSLAVHKYFVDHYMGGIAKVHLESLKKAEKKSDKKVDKS
jgi:lipoprotein NlpI